MIVLDTHAFLWMLQDSPRLSRTVRETVRDLPAEETAVSTASLFEIVWLIRRERITIHGPAEAFLTQIESAFPVLPVTAAIAIAAAQLPPTFPSDPMDRFIAATAIVHRVPLVTADRAIRRSRALRTLW